MELPSMHPILLIFIFSTLVEAVMEFLFANVLLIKPYFKLISMVVGIMLAFYYQVNIFESVLQLVHVDPFFDYLFSGMLVARMSNYLNDLVERILQK